jgi:4-diphosphocytidyl-2-C-methyl-D-erythritol kinase
VSKRADGYHNLETCFYPVLWTDALEIIPAATFSFTTSGNSIPGNATNNLCVKAYQILEKDFTLTPVSIHLHKVVPTGAGLGGGSSDGAHTLLLLNRLFNLNIPVNQLKAYALQLGSDCPFFIESKPMLGYGRGEELEPVALNLAGKFVVLVKPPVHVSTAEAYAGVKPGSKSTGIREIVESHPRATWQETLVNDFETSVFKKYPVIKELKDRLYTHGAVYASMSGSGSAVFGIFDKPVHLQQDFAELDYWSGVL